MPIRVRSMTAIEAVQAAEELGFEAIGGPPDVDEVCAQRVCRDMVDQLVDECIDGRIQTLSRIRDRERLHRQSIPNTCSPTPAINTDKVMPLQSYRHLRQ